MKVLLATRAAEGLGAAVDRPSIPPPATTGRLSRAALPAAAAATAGIASVARFGYTFGTGDHLVLMPKGISLADPGAFANDWFVHNAPQPHWLFDAVTYVGTRLGALPLVYLAWWLVSLAAFGLGAVWLTRRFLPGNIWPAILLGPILVFGPQNILGSTTPLLGIAMPHVLGGCLAFAALTALLNGYWKPAVIGSLLAGLVHAQHGANIALVLLLAAILASGWSRRSRLTLAATSLVLVVGAGVVGWARQIDNSGNAWLEICEVAAPFHCDANSWVGPYLLSGFLVVGLALGLLLWCRSDWRRLFPPIGLPATGLTIAVIADRLDIAVIGELAQRFNAYRLAAFVAPFAAFALIMLAFAGRRMLRLVLFPLLLFAWIWVQPESFHFGFDLAQPTLVLAALTFLVAAGALSSLRNASPGALRALIGITACLATVLAIQGGRYPIDLDYERNDPIVAASLDLGRVLPEGSVLAAPPGIIWLKLTQRAVIADCKNVPYGGKDWEEYKSRIAALGGRKCGPDNAGFKMLEPSAIESLRSRFGATHVLLPGDDPKRAFAEAHWRLLWHREGVPRPHIETGWFVFELPPSRSIASTTPS